MELKGWITYYTRNSFQGITLQRSYAFHCGLQEDGAE